MADEPCGNKNVYRVVAFTVSPGMFRWFRSSTWFSRLAQHIGSNIALHSASITLRQAAIIRH